MSCSALFVSLGHKSNDGVQLVGAVGSGCSGWGWVQWVGGKQYGEIGNRKA